MTINKTAKSKQENRSSYYTDKVSFLWSIPKFYNNESEIQIQ